jgi:hypothetical protein
VPVVTLDHYWNAVLKQRQVSFIKIDVEGHEDLVLKGGKEMFATAPPPFMLVEYNHNVLAQKVGWGGGGRRVWPEGGRKVAGRWPCCVLCCAVPSMLVEYNHRAHTHTHTHTHTAHTPPPHTHTHTHTQGIDVGAFLQRIFDYGYHIYDCQMQEMVAPGEFGVSVLTSTYAHK